MVVIRGDLEEKTMRFLSKQIQRPLDEFCSGAACAGFINDKKNAKKARENHYGIFVLDNGKIVPISSRRFIWEAVKDIDEHGNVSLLNKQEINDILVKRINSDPRIHISGWKSGDVQQTIQRAKSVFKGGDYSKIFKELGEKMRANLIQAILDRKLAGMPMPPVNDVRHNADSTIKRKRKDFPLVDSGEMVSSIQAWVEG